MNYNFITINRPDKNRFMVVGCTYQAFIAGIMKSAGYLIDKRNAADRNAGKKQLAIGPYRNIVDSLITDFDNLSDELRLQVAIAVISDPEYFRDPPEKVSRVFWEYAERLQNLENAVVDGSGKTAAEKQKGGYRNDNE